MLNAPRWRKANFLQGLGEAFGTDLPPQPVHEPHWVARSERLAQELGLADWLGSEQALALLSGARRGFSVCTTRPLPEMP